MVWIVRSDESRDKAARIPKEHGAFVHHRCSTATGRDFSLAKPRMLLEPSLHARLINVIAVRNSIGHNIKAALRSIEEPVRIVNPEVK